MDPFFQIFQELLEQRMNIDEALVEVTSIIYEAENRSMLEELSSSTEGREILNEWRSSWKSSGVDAPWAPLVEQRQE